MSAVRLAAALLLVLGSSSTASGAETDCRVGVVVDFSRFGGGVTARCSSGPDGRDTVEVLRDAGLTVSLGTGGYAGFLCALNGFPENGARDCQANAGRSQYWAFYHREPGSSSWTYSQKGVQGWKPADASQVGFTWTDGQPLPPPLVPQSAVCPGPAEGSGSSTESPRPAGRPSPSTVMRSSARPAPAAPEAHVPLPHSTSSPRTSPPAPPATTVSAAGATVPTSAPTGRPADLDGISTDAPLADAAVVDDGVSPTLWLGIGLVVALMGSAVVRARRRRA